MSDRPAEPSIGIGISAVERDTGLSKDTLRVWERRYGFPSPERDAFGERLYSATQVAQLVLIQRLLSAGLRPGKVVGLPLEELERLSASLPGSGRGSEAGEDLPPKELSDLVQLVRDHAIEDLRADLSRRIMRSGLEPFVLEVCGPLTRLIGEAWSRGEVEVYEEHLYTEIVQSVLRGAISSRPAVGGRPRVLLTTFPNEEHGLGLLMAEALMALEGCRCVSLGTRTPVRDIDRAARAGEADVVALSFSVSLNPNQVLDGLAELRARLPANVEIWAGGGSPVLQRRPPPGVVVISALSGVRELVSRWRTAHGL